MKALCLILSLLAGQAWGAFAPGTTGLYDIEQNLSDTAGTSHGTELRAMSYQTTGAWHSTYCGGGNGQFSIPAATLPSNSGTIELSYRTGASIPNSSDEIVIGTTVGGTRTLEVYNFGGSAYIYSGAFGWNTAFQATATNTNYYFKITYDAGNIKIYSGTWTVAGTVTLTQVFSATGTYTQLAGVNSVTFMRNPVDPNNGTYFNPGFIDWIRTRNIYDPTTTVTVDPSGPSGPLSPYIKNSNNNWMMPKLFLFLDKFFARPLYALESNCRVEQAKNVFELSKVEVKIKKDNSDAIAAKLADGISKGKVTYTATPTRTPPVTPTRTPVK